MSEAKKRKIHTPEFKAKVGLEALRGEKTINEIGQAYGVHPVQVGLWKKVSMANRIEPFLAINFEPLFQRKITYSVLISVDSFPLPA